ncbi:HEAT repeats family protein [Mycobacterium avium subsp. avium 2285 (R)]|nr:HEAT repeats family protein [Mycobacterium avium subsp. avium 2285 (R)]
MRRTAVATLTENTPEGYAPALLAALGDDAAAVRAAAAEGVRELVEVLPEPESVRAHLDSSDRVVRAAALYVLAARRAGDAARYRRALGDPDHRVRIEAVRALVSVDDVDGVVDAAGDENREVRIAAAAGLATLRDGTGPAGGAVRALVADPTRWCVPPGWPRSANWAAAQTITGPSRRRCARRRGRCAKARRGRWPVRPPRSRCRCWARRWATRTWTCARPRCSP